jgi:hypothetical protein
VFTGERLAGRLRLYQHMQRVVSTINCSYFIVGTLRSLWSSRRLESQRWLIGLGRSPTTLPFPKVFESSRDMDDRLRSFILRIGPRAHWELGVDLRSFL